MISITAERYSPSYLYQSGLPVTLNPLCIFMSKKITGTGPELDEIVIEELLSFDTLTTIKPNDRSITVQFQFILNNIQEIQIIGCLFEKGQRVQMRSALLKRLGLDPNFITITTIRMTSDTLYWECVADL